MKNKTKAKVKKEVDSVLDRQDWGNPREFAVVDLDSPDAQEFIEALYNVGYKGYRHFCTDTKSLYVFRLQ